MTETEFRDMILEAVVTVTEIAYFWGKQKKVIMMAIYKDKLQARQARPGAAWLVTRSSVIRLYGQPIRED